MGLIKPTKQTAAGGGVKMYYYIGQMLPGSTDVSANANTYVTFTGQADCPNTGIPYTDTQELIFIPVGAYTNRTYSHVHIVKCTGISNPGGNIFQLGANLISSEPISVITPTPDLDNSIFCMGYIVVCDKHEGAS